MGKLLTPLTRRESVNQLRQKLAHADDAEQKTRIRAIIHIKEGATRAEVGRRFCIDPKTLRAWVCAYNKGGTKALVFSKGGRLEGNPTWDTEPFDELIKEIDKQDRYWSVPIMQEWIEAHHGVYIPESTIWYHVRALNYSYKSSRPHPAQGNEQKQEYFKKGALKQPSKM